MTIKRSFGFTLLVLSVTLCLAADTPSSESGRSEQELLLGTWTTFLNGRTFNIPVSETKFGSKLLYTIRPEKKPKEIDMVHRAPKDHPRISIKGIYSLEKNILKVCWVYEGARPSKFESDVKNGRYLMTLKRIRKKP